MEFLKLWEIIVRRKTIIIVTFFAFFAAIVIGTYFATPMYEAKAKILIKSSDSASSLMSVLGLTLPTGKSADETYETEIALTTIRPLIEKLISNLELKDPNGDLLKPEKLLRSSIINNILAQPTIEVEQYEDSDILDITSDSRSSTEAAAMSNELAKLYIEDTLEQTRKEYKSARIFIENQIEDIKGKYYAALMAKKEFMMKEETVDLSAEISRQLEYISSLKNDYKDKEIEISGRKVDFTEEHPEVSGLIKERESLKQLIEKAQDDLMKIPTKSTKQSEIDLSLSVNQDIYKNLLEYLTQVGVAESMTLSNIRLVEPAMEPEKPDFPKKILNYVLGIFLGLFLAFSLVFFIEYIDNTIKSPTDIKRIGTLTQLGNIPKSRHLKNKGLISNLAPTSALIEGYRTIRNGIRYASVDKQLKTLVVTSSIENEGKSSVVSNIAITFSMEGKKVIVVDLNLRKPALHKFFKVPAYGGVTSVLIGKIQLEEAIIHTSIEGIDVLPSGPVPPDPSKLVESQKIKDIIDNLKKTYDLIIIDTPPAVTINDAIVIGAIADGILYVIEYGKVTLSMIRHVCDVAEKANLNLIGVVLNKIKAPGAGYYHYYSRYDQE
jgi:tyrosine-protein kinase Etk/Wzc